MNCTRCESTGFLNLDLLPAVILRLYELGEWEEVSQWIKENDTECQVCDCCGDGENWYGEPGSHNANDNGHNGPYAYNGGLPKCN
jgi:hypothetical protein